MDRLGFPYKTGRQCESCPDSCESATNREYKKKSRNKSKRSVPEVKELTHNHQLQDETFNNNQVGIDSIKTTSYKLLSYKIESTIFYSNIFQIIYTENSFC